MNSDGKMVRLNGSVISWLGTFAANETSIKTKTLVNNRKRPSNKDP